MTANFGQGPFTYAVPTGFKAGLWDDCSAANVTYPAPGGATCGWGVPATTYTYERPTGAGPEVHVLGSYDYGTVSVNVTGTARPVILVLMSVHTSTWNVTAAPGATIQQIYTAFYDPVTLNAPGGVPVQSGNASPYSPTFPSQIGSVVAGKWVQDTFGVTPHTARNCDRPGSFTVTSVP